MKNFLTSEERARLKGQHRRERDGRIRDWIKAVLLSDEEWTYPMIAKALFLDDQTVGNYIKGYRESGKLKHESGGSPGKLTTHETENLIKHLGTTLYLHIHEICTYVEKIYGKSYTVPGMQSWMHNHGFVQPLGRRLPLVLDNPQCPFKKGCSGNLTLVDFGRTQALCSRDHHPL